MERILLSAEGQIQQLERVGRRNEMIRDAVSECIGSVIQAVADYAILEAEGLEKEADEMESRALANRHRATVLRDLHAIAAPHAREAMLMMIHSKVG